jgi:hypothetical protein
MYIYLNCGLHILSIHKTSMGGMCVYVCLCLYEVGLHANMYWSFCECSLFKNVLVWAKSLNAVDCTILNQTYKSIHAFSFVVRSNNEGACYTDNVLRYQFL